jgi:3'-phosphoadenosine 5'-phosphosulfate sulfotransferase (PAPS reductase)/FAD synthetase
MIALVSTSGGKDSTATLLLAMERLPREAIFPVFADTGNEHPVVYEYLDYLESKTGLVIKRLRPDFTDWWWRRRDYVRDVWPTDGYDAEVTARVLSFMDRGPFGNPYLDLCIIKGRFPSPRAQFCTQFLKTQPLTAYAMDLVAEHRDVESWQGVRADESANRAKMPERETNGEAFVIYRPILRWTVADVFAMHRKHGIEPNPLYKMGMSRVGCMPCINAKKDELLEISRRFPEHIARIAEWEKIVGPASARGCSTFFYDPESEDGLGISKTVEWAKTERGGVQYDLLRSADGPGGCASSYGLCEPAAKPETKEGA